MDALPGLTEDGELLVPKVVLVYFLPNSNYFPILLDFGCVKCSPIPIIENKNKG